MKSERSFAENLLLNSAGRLASPLAALVTLPLLARSLGVEGRGEVAAVTSPFLLASAAATIGLPDALAYFAAKRPGTGKRLFRKLAPYAFLAGGLAGLLVALGSDWLAAGDDRLRLQLSIVALATPLAILVALARGRAVGERLWARVRLEQILNALMSLVGFSVLAALGLLTQERAVMVFVLAQLVGGVSYFRMREVEAPGDDVPKTRTAASYGLRAWVGSAAGVALSRMDQALLTNLSNAEELGLYAVAASVSELPLVFSGALGLMVFAHDAAEENDARLARVSRVGFGICAGLAIAICATAPWVFPFLFGEGFQDAIPTTAILLLAVVGGMPGSVAGSALAARGHIGLRSWGLLVALVVNVGVLLVAAPVLGAEGAALATLAGNYAAAAWMLMFLRFREGVSVWQFFGVRREDVRLISSKVGNRLRSLRGSAGKERS